MTNEQRLASLIGYKPADPNAIEGALLDAGIDPTGTYVPTSSLEIKKCAVPLLRLLLSTPDTSNESGGFVKKYDRDAVLQLIADYEGVNPETGVVAVAPTIRSISHLW